MTQEPSAKVIFRLEGQEDEEYESFILVGFTEDETAMYTHQRVQFHIPPLQRMQLIASSQKLLGDITQGFVERVMEMIAEQSDPEADLADAISMIVLHKENDNPS